MTQKHWLLHLNQIQSASVLNLSNHIVIAYDFDNQIF
jgi:hypothetical protein